ncbi:MAG: hypothetical protein Q4Q06_01150 [Bacteroidota bacterium]|nr:hypothetical protein [Bacteroidota bacterium]
MKRFRNRLHGLYADLGKRYVLTTVNHFCTHSLQKQQLSFKKVVFLFTFLFSFSLISFADNTANQVTITVNGQTITEFSSSNLPTSNITYNGN